MFEWLSRFRLAVLELHLEARDTIILPTFKGSTLRGAFGHAFRRITCVGRTRDAKDCGDCSLIQVCPYHYVFESSPMRGDSGELEGPLSNYDDVPRPFVIEPPTDTREVYEPGESIVFRIILIGNGIEFFPYFIVAFRELGEEGIGRDRRRGVGRFWLRRVKGIAPSGEHLLYDGAEGKVYNIKRFWFSAEEAYRQWLSLEAQWLSSEAYRPRSSGEARDHRLSADCEALSEAGGSKAGGTGMGESSVEDSKVERNEAVRGEARESKARGSTPVGVDPGGRKTKGSTAAGRLIVGFETPCRLKYERHLVDVPEFHILIRNLLRRISALARFHHSFELDVDFKGIIESSLRVRLTQNRTRWVDWERYSARQSSKMKLGGIMGVAVYQFIDGAAGTRTRPNGSSGLEVLSGLPPAAKGVDFLLPFIVVGEYVHVGKNVTFGLGKLRSILDFS